MSTTSIVVKPGTIAGRKYAEDRNVIVKHNNPVKNKKNEAIKRKIYHEVLKTFKSIVIVFAFLVVYKSTGLHEWWIQLVDKIL